MAGRPADTPQSANFLTNRKNQMKHDKTFEAINKLKEVELELHRLKNALEMTNRALETKDEPVAWGMETDGLIYDVICPDEHEREEGEYTIPLYTTPQQRKPLTRDEVEKLFWEWKDRSGYSIALFEFRNICNAIEAAHGIKE